MKRILATILITGLLTACGKKETPMVKATSLPDVFNATPCEAKPQPIPEARKAAAGSEVVLEGKIMGVDHPFVENRAVFVLGDDATITSCDEDESDGCKTPWDACCDPADVRINGTATIQILDESGKVLAQGLKNVGGLKELSRVVVCGIVDEKSSVEGMIVNATAISIKP